MDVLSPSHPCKQVVLMSAAQMLKTSVMVNFLGYIADVDPGPTLAVEPRSEDAKALSKDRVAPLFRHSPALRGKLAAVKSRDSNNTAMHKMFANGSGHITFTGAISPSGLAMRPIRYLLLDEVDRYPLSAGSEGDPVSLAMQRTGEFEHNKKVIMCSTPTVDGESRIQAAWNTSDQREYFVPCPKCNHFQILVFSDGTDGGLVWPEGEPEKAAYCCEKCRELIPHNQKSWMVDRGEYRPQNPGSPIPGFRVSQLISPKRSWGTIAAEFLVAKLSTETLKGFLNTVLAELWTERGSAPDWEKKYLRREDYNLGIVSAKGSLLVAGVDVQDDRLEVEIKAYGRGKESWSVDYRVIQVPDQAGHALKTSSPEVWQELEALLATDWPCESGGTMPIIAMTIDTGFRPQMVYEFAAPSATGSRPGRRQDLCAAHRGADQGHAGLSETDRAGVAYGRGAQAAERSDLAHWHALGEAGVLRLAADRAARRWHVPTRIPALRLQGSGLLSRALLRVANHPIERQGGVGTRQVDPERTTRPRGALPRGCGHLRYRLVLR
jgi:phage terminase large subunit GpA-like protein